MSPLLQSTERPSPLGAPNNLSSPSSDLSEFDIITNRNRNQDSNLNNGKSPNNNTNGNDPFDLGHLDDLLGGPVGNNEQTTGKSTGCIKKTPQSFLGENSALVNLDNLIKPTPPLPSVNPAPFGTVNPFQDLNTAQQQQPIKNNLFQQQMQPVKPSMNQIKQPPFALTEAVNNPVLSRDPWAPLPHPQPNTNSDMNSPWTPVSNISKDANNLNSPWTIQPSRDPNSAWLKQEQQSVNPFLS